MLHRGYGCVGNVEWTVLLAAPLNQQPALLSSALRERSPSRQWGRVVGCNYGGVLRVRFTLLCQGVSQRAAPINTQRSLLPPHCIAIVPSRREPAKARRCMPICPDCCCAPRRYVAMFARHEGVLLAWTTRVAGSIKPTTAIRRAGRHGFCTVPPSLAHVHNRLSATNRRFQLHRRMPRGAPTASGGTCNVVGLDISTSCTGFAVVDQYGARPR